MLAMPRCSRHLQSPLFATGNGEIKLCTCKPARRLIIMAHMESELSELIGRKVDFRTAEDLTLYLRDQVVQEAYTLYEQ